MPYWKFMLNVDFCCRRLLNALITMWFWYWFQMPSFFVVCSPIGLGNCCISVKHDMFHPGINARQGGSVFTISKMSACACILNSQLSYTFVSKYCVNLIFRFDNAKKKFEISLCNDLYCKIVCASSFGTSHISAFISRISL